MKYHFYTVFLFIALHLGNIRSIHAQAPSGTSASNYIFTTIPADSVGVSNSFTTDINGNVYTMPGATLITANKQNENSYTYIAPCWPDPSCSYKNIGFDFYFMGTRANQFVVNTEGILGFPVAANGSSGTEVNGGCKRIGEVDQTNGLETRISAFTGTYARTNPTTGSVTYKTIGTAPYRTLVVEWKDIDFRNYPPSATSLLSTYQVKLYETTNVIDFVYGGMSIGTLGTYQAGFSFGISPEQRYTIGNFMSNVLTSSTNAGLTTYIGTNPIPGLNSINGDGKRREIMFDPVTGTSNTPPANLVCTPQGATATLSWDDAPNEIMYDIYYSADPNVPLDIDHSNHLTAPQNATTAAINTAQVTPTGNFTKDSTTVSFGSTFGSTPVSNVWIGAAITGTGIAPGTYITGIDRQANKITLSIPALSTGSAPLTTSLRAGANFYFKVFARREALSEPATASTDPSGCQAPVLTAQANNTATSLSICPGQAVSFTANPSGGANCTGNYEYAWSDGNNYWSGNSFASATAVYNTSYNNISLYLSVSGSYTVTGQCSTNTGCSNSSVVTVNVEVKPVANFTPTGSGLQISFTSTSTGAVSYRWDFGDGDTSILTNPVHTYATPGIYNVCLTVTSAQSCISDKICKSVQTDIGTPIDETSVNEDWKIYPNPVGNELFITLNPDETALQIELCDLAGRAVRPGNLYLAENGILRLELGNLVKGLYVLKIKTKENDILRLISKY